MVDPVVYTGMTPGGDGFRVNLLAPINMTFNTVATFIGSGLPANIGINSIFYGTNSALPDIGQQIVLYSSAGFPSAGTAFKIGLAVGVIGTTTSANIYGINTIVGGFGGTGGYLVTGDEVDIQNYGVNAPTVEAATSVYGRVTVASGSAYITAGNWAYGSAFGNVSGQYYGYAVSGNTITAAYLDQSNAPSVLRATGTRVTGIDFLSATFSSSFAMIAPNGSTVGFLDSGGVPRNGFGLDSSNILQVGAASNLFINMLAPVKFPSYTTVQKNALSPTEGWAVIDSTLHKLSIYLNGSWQTVTSV